jgi:hypothetical protein
LWRKQGSDSGLKKKEKLRVKNIRKDIFMKHWAGYLAPMIIVEGRCTRLIEAHGFTEVIIM